MVRAFDAFEGNGDWEALVPAVVDEIRLAVLFHFRFLSSQFPVRSPAMVRIVPHAIPA